MRKPKKRIMLETENPLMTTIAKGCCIGTPAPIPGDKGRSAKATANVVIKIGHTRTDVACHNDFSRFHP